jgi:RimJ/RimL family protein N-acetyltransferase
MGPGNRAFFVLRINMMNILITPRLTLRPPIALDADDIAHWLLDWDVTKMLGRVPWPYSLDDAEKWVSNASDPQKQIYTIHRQSLIGVAGFVGSGSTRTLGYWLAKPWHRHGFMREALTCLFDLTFSDQLITTIESGVVTDNPASLKLQAGLGFEITGEMEADSIPRKSKVTVINTVLKRETWLNYRIVAVSEIASSLQQQSSQFAA